MAVSTLREEPLYLCHLHLFGRLQSTSVCVIECEGSDLERTWYIVLGVIPCIGRNFFFEASFWVREESVHSFLDIVVVLSQENDCFRRRDVHDAYDLIDQLWRRLQSHGWRRRLEKFRWDHLEVQMAFS